ncbi:DNA polymerase alpha subunit B [Cephus cinctus]|uniref:DNA polymerase alpha subunit B n=1 Tax=Cephus cinctus TaxID=211228 RepID=A0AAJ7FCF8_CEPCN|nr:DNA polymerase alpha subunit B [Cephus cinctus]
MVAKEALIEQFQALGSNVEDNAVLNKCLDLCDSYGIDEETFVEIWVAFSVPRYKSLDPTLEGLGQLERIELKKGNKLRVEKDLSKLAVYNSCNSKQYNENDDLLEMYGGRTPTTPKVKRLRSPESDTPESENKVRAVENQFSPVTYSQTPITPTRKSSRSSSGKVLLSFGEGVVSWKNNDKTRVEVEKTEDPHVPAKAMYMFELLSKKFSIMNLLCQDVGTRICEYWHRQKNDDVPITWNVRSKSLTYFRTWGKVVHEMKGKLNNKSVMLVGCKTPLGQNKSSCVRMDLSNVEQYSLFPGQIIAVECKNPTEDLLIVKEIFAHNYAPPSKPPQLLQNLHVMVAAGPFTPMDNLNYGPLWDLMKQVVQNEPHLLILIGPFIEFTHPEIEKGTIADTFQELFEQLVSKMMTQLQGTCTQVVLIPSNRDAHHDPIYPTPEFFVSKAVQNPNLHLMPDPCMLSVQGFTVGVTSVDSLMHLGREEITSNMMGMDKLGRLANHLLSQSCYYPLYPPAEEVNVDMTLWEKYAFMDQQPHLLILPSAMRHFCKTIKGCVVLNPERANKYLYARLVIKPAVAGVWNQDKVSCEILQI